MDLNSYHFLYKVKKKSLYGCIGLNKLNIKGAG